MRPNGVFNSCVRSACLAGTGNWASLSERFYVCRRRRRRRRSSVVPVKSEFRDMDRTNRCRITRSTFLSKEVGSDSLILGVGAALSWKRATKPAST